MILFVRESANVREYCADGTTCVFSVLGRKCSAEEENGSWKLQLHDELRTDPSFVPASRNMIRLTNADQTESAFLILLAGDENWKEYDCWKMPDSPFTIGSCDMDTVSYDHELLSEGGFQIDPKTKEMT